MSAVWALARAPAMAPIDSLDRCMTGLLVQQIEADRAGFRALGADAVASHLLGVLGHQAFQFGLRTRRYRLDAAASPGSCFARDTAVESLTSPFQTLSNSPERLCWKAADEFICLASCSQPSTMPIKIVRTSGCVSTSARSRHPFASSL